MASKYITIGGRCATTGKLLGFQFRVGEDGNFYAVGSYSLSAGAAAPRAEEYHGKFLSGPFKCKYCGNNNFVRCPCGAFLCCTEGAESITCPECGQTTGINWVTADEIDPSTASGGVQ